MTCLRETLGKFIGVFYFLEIFMAFDSTSVFDNLNPANNISDFSKNVTQGLKKYSGDAVKAIDPVKNKLKDGVALFKSTESQVTGTITAYKSSVVEKLNSIVNSLTGGLIDTKDLSRYIKIGANGVSLDKAGITAALGAKIGFDLSSNAALMNQITNTMNQEFGDLTGGYFGNMVTSDNGSFRITKNWRDQFGNGFLNALQRTTGISTSLFDNTIATAYNNSMLYTAADYGMSDSYAQIVNAYTDKEDAKTALINAVSYMLRNGDLVSIAKVLELIDPYQYAVLNAKYPQLISQIFGNFTLDPNTTIDQYPAIKQQLMDVCGKVVGTTWYLRNNAFGQTYDMGMLGSISTDIKKVMLCNETYPELIPLICTSGMFASMNAISAFQQNFPNVPMLDQSE